jgi:diamine N-acetyltransferase
MGNQEKLLAWVLDYGRAQGCVASELNCYINNDTGNSFWQQEGFVKIGYHYQKSLT